PSAVCSSVRSRPEDRSGTGVRMGPAAAQATQPMAYVRGARPRAEWQAAACGLLHQPQGERIAVGDAFVGLDRGNDDEHQCRKSDQQHQRPDHDEADAQGHEAQRQQDHHDPGDGDVEVQRFLGLFRGEGQRVLLDLPDDEWPDHATHAGQPAGGEQAAKQRGKMREHRPLPLFGAGAFRRWWRRWRRWWWRWRWWRYGLVDVAHVSFPGGMVLGGPDRQSLHSIRQTAPKPAIFACGRRYWSPATVILPTRIGPVRMCERGSMSLPTASMPRNIARRLPAM